MVSPLKQGPRPWFILYPCFVLPRKTFFSILQSGNITVKILPKLLLFLALKPHTTELSIHIISLLVLSEPPIHFSNISCPGRFTLLTELDLPTSVLTFFTLVFLKKQFLFSKQSMCLFPLAWYVKADCPEVESSNTLWQTLHRNLFFVFDPA